MINRLGIANKIFENMSRSLEVNSLRCTRVRHKSSDCTLCHMYCATDAIKMSERPGMTIKIDRDKCTDCGICVNVCPTDSYRFLVNTHKDIMLNLIKNIRKNGSIHIYCSQRVEADDSVFVNCHGILEMTDILTLYLSGASKITFRYDDCEECVIKNGYKILSQSIENLKLLTTMFSYLVGTEITKSPSEIVIQFSKQFDIVEIKEEVKVEELVDRRGMFSFYKNRGVDSAKSVAGYLIPREEPDRVLVSFETYQPNSRARFLDTIMKLGDLLVDTVQTGRYFNMIEIDSDCVYCGVCAKFCPTGALSIDEDRTELRFNPSKCVSCYLCQPACYHNKLRYEAELNLELFFDNIILISKDNSVDE